MKNLKDIPERFHILFTDKPWNNGNESELTSLQRADIHQIYLEYNRWSIQQSINPPSTKEEEPVIGFVKD